MLKQIFVISAIFFTASANQCFECNGKPGTAYYAKNPRGCAWFFVCNPNEPPTEGVCPNDLLFDHANQMCNYRDLVDCTDPQPVTQCPNTGFAVISHPDTCSKFIVCFDGQEQDVVCEAGKRFSPFEGACIDASLVDCSVDAVFCEANRDAPAYPRVKNSRSCSSYYLCSNDNFVIPRQCSTGLHFNPDTGHCEPEDTLSCQITEPNIDDFPTTFDFDCSNEPDGSAHPVPDTCDFWYICAGGNPIIQRCGSEAIFDINQSRCVSQDFPSATCIAPSTTTTEDPTTTTTDPTTTTIAP